MTDDLHTPIMQMTAAGTAYWQAAYTPYGAIYSLTTADAHQPLRRPGQEAEEYAVGNPNGLTQRYYNGFRWYRPAYGRYTQADPIEYAGGAFNLYSYADDNPMNEVDPLGLAVYIGYHPIVAPGIGVVGNAGHTFIEVVPDDGSKSQTFSGEPVDGKVNNVPNADAEVHTFRSLCSRQME